MTLRKDERVSAQVVLRPAADTTHRARPPLTAENLGKFAPARGAVAAVAESFRSSGLEVGPFVGISFSVTGSVDAFEKLLGVPLRRVAGGGIKFVVAGGDATAELPAEHLPMDLRPLIQAIVFPPPPDFGPTGF